MGRGLRPPSVEPWPWGHIARRRLPSSVLFAQPSLWLQLPGVLHRKGIQRSFCQVPLVWWLVRAVAGCCTGSAAHVCCLAPLRSRGYMWRWWLVSKPSRLLSILRVLSWSSCHTVAARISYGCQMLASGDSEYVAWSVGPKCITAGNQVPFRASGFKLLKLWNVLNERQRPAGL